jgi:hypothetical protein
VVVCGVGEAGDGFLGCDWGFGGMTVLVRVGTVAASRRFGFELVKPSSVVVTGSGSETATISALGSVEFSAAATLSLNGVFSSGYDNYMISARTQSSAGSVLFGRLRASGTDESSASNYYTDQYLFADGTTVAANRTTRNQWYIAYLGSPLRNGFVAYWYGPYLAQPTAGRTVVADSYLNAETIDAAYTHSLSNSYDGFTLLPASGTVTGLVTVFGFNQ